MSRKVWTLSKWKSYLLEKNNEIHKIRGVPMDTLKIAEAALALYEEQIAIVEKQRNVEDLEYMSEVKCKIDAMCWEVLMTPKEWREKLRVEQMEINTQKERKEGLAYCEIVVKRCDTLYEQQNAKVESQLEDLRQKHGAASEEYKKKIEDWNFLSDIKETIENMSGEVSDWQFPSEEQDEEEQQEEEVEYRDSGPQACPFGIYLVDEASADEDSADEDSADNPSTDESPPTDESQATQATPKRRKMYA
jgi:hypothetical protein